MRIKGMSWIVLMVLFLASCFEQQVMEETLSSQKLTEQKSMTVTSQDSVMSLLYQARWGDGSAYLKLADCYRDGIGVKKDFFGIGERVSTRIRNKSRHSEVLVVWSYLSRFVYSPRCFYRIGSKAR